MERRFIGPQQLGEYLGISVRTIRYWITMRKIPYFKMGRHVRFDLKEVEAWSKERRVKEIA